MDRDLGAEFDATRDVLSKRLDVLEAAQVGIEGSFHTIDDTLKQNDAFKTEMQDRLKAIEHQVTDLATKPDPTETGMSADDLKTIKQARKLIDTYYFANQALHVDE